MDFNHEGLENERLHYSSVRGGQMISITAYIMLLFAFILEFIALILSWKKNIKLAEENGRLIQLIHELNKDIGKINKREAENGKID